MALPDSTVENTQSDHPDSSVTVRAVVGGLALALLVIVWNTYVEYIAHTARMNITHFPIALFIPYTVLALTNGVARRLGASWVLTSAELLVMLAMGLVGAAVPAYGLTSYFLGLIAIPYYLATPENQWASYFHQYLPTWLIPSNEGDAMRWLFEGLPSPEMPIPWSVWTIPLVGWLTFITAIVVGSICFSVMLRKQWAEHERLAYPILHAASDLAEAEDRRSLLSNRVFWVGAIIPFAILAWNMASYFNPGFPRIRLGTGWMSMGSYFPRIHFSFNFYTIGFAYFANVDVLFSIWAFYLFYCSQIAIYRRVGISLSSKSGSGDATTSLQAGGAFIALVLWGLWLARDHLRDVFRKAFDSSLPIDDSQELLSYRACVFGFLFSVVFLIFWLQVIGIAWTVSVVVTLGIFLLYMGAARVIAETGVVYFSMPMTPNGVVPFLFGGPNALGGPSQTALRLIDAVRSLPSIREAAVVQGVPMRAGSFQSDGAGTIEGYVPATDTEELTYRIRVVSPGYFATLEIPIVAGRPFEARDEEGARGAARSILVSDSFAKRYWPGQDPLGRRMTFGEAYRNWMMTVVGVVGDVQYAGLEMDPTIDLYIPQGLFPQAAITLIARTRGDALNEVSEVRERILAVD